jgi:pyruvate dehydrogenase E2 component (dihydrolipoamide acetyltransferase)
MAIEIVMPKLGWTMEEGVLVEWLKKEGDAVRAGDILFTVESDKALQEIEAFDSGVLRIPPDSPPPGSKVRVGARLGYLIQPGEISPLDQTMVAQAPELRGFSTREESSFAASRSVEPTTSRSATAMPTISPRARRIASELGVDWMNLLGSGRTGRIVERDVRLAAGQRQPIPVATVPAALSATSVALGAARSPLSSVRRLIAQRMSESAHTTAPVTLTTEVDATELVRLREQLKADPAASQHPIPTYTDLLAKLSAHALREHPELNSRLEGEEIVTEAAVHIGIAVDTERGLLVPVLREVQDKSLRQLAAEAHALLTRTREGKVNADELRGSTFTLTNLGMYEIDAFTPIIHLPECAILGIGRIVPKQVVINASERVAVRQMMFLSLTFDHRLVDGAPAARFLQRIKQLVEQPYLWLVT